MNFISSKIDTSDKPTKIYPLPHMYVVKDLVPDMNQFYEQYRSVQPWLQRDDEKNLGSGDKQLLQSTEDRQKLVSDSMNLSFTVYLRMVFFHESVFMILGRPLRVHPVRLLLNFVPVLLVEHGPVPGPRRADAGLQVDHRLPRSAAGGEVGQTKGPLLSLQASSKNRNKFCFVFRLLGISHKIHLFSEIQVTKGLAAFPPRRTDVFHLSIYVIPFLRLSIRIGCRESA